MKRKKSKLQVRTKSTLARLATSLGVPENFLLGTQAQEGKWWKDAEGALFFFSSKGDLCRLRAGNATVEKLSVLAMALRKEAKR